MEASNVFGSPMAAPGETPVYTPGQEQTPAPQQAETAAAPAQPAAPATPQAPEAPQDPVLAAINEMRQEIGEIKQGQAPQADPGLDLFTALNQEPEPEFEAQAPEPQTPQQPQVAEGDEQLNALYSLVDDRATQIAQRMVEPLVADRTVEQMTAVQKRHPDIMEPQNLKAVVDRIGALEARRGIEGLLDDPQMVEDTFKLVKAEAAEATAVAPADAGGAVLETGAGQSQTGGSSFEDDYVNSVFAPRQGTPSIFGG